MTTEHTAGRLSVEAREKYEVGVFSEDMPVATCYDFTEESIANAHRLAACWNACEGIETEELEHLKFIVNDDSTPAAGDQNER